MNRSTTPPPPNADLPSPGEVYRMFFHDSSAIEAVSGDPEPLSSIMDCSFIVACCDGIGLFREMNKREGPMDAVGQRPQPPFRSEDSRSNGNGDGFEGVNEAPALHGSITQPTIDAGLPRRGSRLALEDATMMRFAHSSASTPTPTPTSSSLETPPTPSHFANWIPPYYDPAHSYPPTSSGSATSSLYSESAISQGFTDEMTTLMDRSTFSEFWSLPDPFHGPVVPPSLTVADRQSPSVTHPLSWAAAPLAETGLWAPPSAAQKGQGADEGQTAQVRGGRGGSHGRKRSATRSKSGTKRRSATGQKDSDQVSVSLSEGSTSDR
ncbi:hypothetical protein IAR55_005111 [Kwoniella newhampshirensis]|uniref:Uncharacterized protein n=1 Tax=Kwoniella newhampshirensis TaxID=1651941 RepID=A0AAW0YJ02_9TREE